MPALVATPKSLVMPFVTVCSGARDRRMEGRGKQVSELWPPGMVVGTNREAAREAIVVRGVKKCQRGHSDLMRLPTSSSAELKLLSVVGAQSSLLAHSITRGSHQSAQLSALAWKPETPCVCSMSKPSTKPKDHPNQPKDLATPHHTCPTQGALHLVNGVLC